MTRTAHNSTLPQRTVPMVRTSSLRSSQSLRAGLVREGEAREASPARRPIKARSLKRARQEREYARLRAEFMADHPVCAHCLGPSQECHHRRGRVGPLLTDVRYFTALCASCHRLVGERPAWAVEVGLSERRVS